MHSSGSSSQEAHNNTNHPVLVVEEARVSGENHDYGRATGKLYHLRLRVIICENTIFVPFGPLVQKREGPQPIVTTRPFSLPCK